MVRTDYGDPITANIPQTTGLLAAGVVTLAQAPRILYQDFYDRREGSAMTVLGCIEEGTPLGTLARAESLPCCSLVAAMVLEQVGHHPDPATLDAYADADPAYWPPANVWSRDAPWSALTAARSLLRGRWAYESLVGEREVPSMCTHRSSPEAGGTCAALARARPRRRRRAAG